MAAKEGREFRCARQIHWQSWGKIGLILPVSRSVVCLLRFKFPGRERAQLGVLARDIAVYDIV